MAIRDTSNDNINFGSSSRARVYKYIIAFAAVIFIGRLGQLQIIQGSSYKSESETQAIKQLVVEPFRGNIFDRNGKLIVHNEASFSVVMTPNDFNLDALPLLLSLLPLDTNEIIKAYSVVASEEEFKKKFLPKISTLLKLDPKKINIKGADRQKFSRFTPVKIYKDANFSEISMVQEYSDYLPGVDILVESKRLYEFEGNMAHLLGYTREISDQELKKYQYYRQGDNIGKKGLEKSYENLLRGQPGIQFVAVNSRGEKISSFDRGQSDIRSTNGFDLTLGIDKDLQELAEKKLSENNSRGSVVAIDPSNGEIMILAAKPDFDPRQFTGKITSDFYKSIMNDPDKPMYNRAIQSVYSPGSTWKMLVAIAGLQEGYITENTTLNCSGGFTYGGRVFKCHGAHGAVNVKRAIQASCNVFFYQLGLKIGMENFEKYGKMFGFGDLTYIDIPDENKGILPTMSWLQARKIPFTKGKLLNYGIGQGEISVSPLQMAIYCATLANKGTLYQPHVVRYVHNNITGQVESIAFQQKKLPIDKRVFDIVQQGMFDVVNLPGGTANNAKIPGISVCGKTGTAQNPHGRDHAWFICYAPMENPKIAICVMVENSGFGAVAAAPIARDILYKFFYPDAPPTQDKIVMEKSAADSLEPGMTFGDQ